jgi:hypothetical protein
MVFFVFAVAMQPYRWKSPCAHDYMDVSPESRRRTETAQSSLDRNETVET